MTFNPQDVDCIVEAVLEKILPVLDAGKAPAGGTAGSGGDSGVFEDLDEAVAAARAAGRELRSVAVREKAVAAIRTEAVARARELAEAAVMETGMGRVEDKVRKNLLQAERTPGVECLQPSAASGDSGLMLTENAPWGVIASVTPCTNPAATVINNAVSMIAGGNAVVFAPHPRAKEVSKRCIQLLNRAVHRATGIMNLLTAVREPNVEAAGRLFSHPGIDLLVVTGGEAVVEAARKRATIRLISAGAGNPPVLVDETADLERAARSVYAGASFDNNIICADEKVLIAVEAIADRLLAAMKGLGAVLLTSDQTAALAAVVIKKNGTPEAAADPAWVGKDAAVLAAAIGLTVPDTCRLLLVDAGRDTDHVFVRVEQMMPVLPLLRAKDAAEGIDWAAKAERGLKHTAGAHSRNIEVLDAMARRMNTSLFVKNGPHIAGLGAGGEGWTSMTISTPTGEGVTNARSFVRLRRCVLVDNFRIV